MGSVPAYACDRADGRARQGPPRRWGEQARERRAATRRSRARASRSTDASGRSRGSGRQALTPCMDSSPLAVAMGTRGTPSIFSNGIIRKRR
jgi:hypothetical protein